MFFFLIQIGCVYYFGNIIYSKFTTYQEDKNFDNKLSEKADVSFVMNQLVEKADKNSIIDFNNVKEFDIGKNSYNINIGNNSHFRNQNINVGFITINKNGIFLDKIPVIKFSSTTMIYCSDNHLFIREGNNTIKLSELLVQILHNQDKIKKNEINIRDLKIFVEQKYYNKAYIQQNYYNKNYIRLNYISKEDTDNILVNNQGYTKSETELIFMSRKDINENFIQKEYFENINKDTFDNSLSINNNVITNDYILCLNDNNIIALSNEYKSESFVGISYIKDNEKLCIKPKYSYLWVSNSKGNINKGDLIICSINGYGCRQDDDIVRSYTIAKCIENVIWNNNDINKKVYCLIY